jgi:hypothetical protein
MLCKRGIIVLTTIKSKIITLTLVLLFVFGLVVVGAAIMAFYHDKEMVIAGNNVSITAFENQMNTEIAELEKEALDLAVMGETYYKNGKQQETGEFFTKQTLKNYPNSMGNGIWFEPYQIDPNNRCGCIHALWDEDGTIGLLPSCVRGDYDYFNRMIENAKANPDFIIWTYTKEYNTVNEWIKNHGETKESLPKNFTVMFSEWRGLEMKNPYGLPEFRVVMKDDESKPDQMKNHYCPGNCDICKKCNRGCVVGETTYCNEH